MDIQQSRSDDQHDVELLCMHVPGCVRLDMNGSAATGCRSIAPELADADRYERER